MLKDEDRIDQLKKKLYSTQEGDVIDVHRTKLPRHAVIIKNSWQDPSESENPVIRPKYEELNQYKDKPNRLRTYLLVAIILFLSAIIFAGYSFFAGSNYVSNNNIDIKLIGPVAIPAGEELSLDVDITNRNRVELLLADLVVTYPEGTRSSGDLLSPLVTSRISLNTIEAGETRRVNIKSILFGEENSQKNINVAIEYRIPDSKSIFTKDKPYQIFIGSSPLAVTVEGLNEVIPEQEADFKVTIKSNSQSLVRGVLLKAEYPFGFEFISAFPEASMENDTWVLGDIRPGETKEITFRGRMLGQENQDRVFRFYTGIEDPSDKTQLGTVFNTNSIDIALRKPFLGIDISLNGKTGQTFVANAGDPIKGEIIWQNNLDTALNDVVIEATLEGEMLNRNTVQADMGFYRSLDNTMIWDRSSISELRDVPPGQVGRLQFSFNPIKLTQENASNLRRQAITINLTIKAKRLNEDRVPVEIVSNLVRSIKMASDLALVSDVVRTVGPFQNTGPIPTVPDVETTYTIVFKANSSYNTIRDAVYTATLPPYVRWTGQVSPDSSSVRYNEDSRQITWTLGEISAGSGYNATAKEFAYQVGFTPSVTQFDSTPILILNQKISGKDNFTETITQTPNQVLDIKMINEPTFEFGDEKVGAKRGAF